MPFNRPTQNPMEGVPAHILALLDRLHAESLDQERSIDRSVFVNATSEEQKKAVVRDKFIALDQDKSQYLYALCRATDARTIVEAGTSFGVSTIYLALAASANAAAGGKKANVIATEYEPTKAARAREYWAQCGDVVTGAIDLREGDLRETLQENLEDVDLLLLDIWTEMALPTLKIVQKKMRRGAIVIADNTTVSEGYDEMLTYMRNPDSGFITMTLPFNQGLEFCVYLPKN
ncbi:O-methyltransferase [Cordyceps fumosorosea ARSEF 2679]|uniref:O-methyltransferase n=1 Tax=Cordyceps fumosorosea (strain ARSEF 2679) TaxID=1081104 RepID=A0A168AT60_CORFA|nr:O-methyltransferase [Cordyceps fumosorosea ARSEF 2679]OAA69161.1 O-methyltransferase [Cordyceps fumosorosea ARSEF 2679]